MKNFPLSTEVFPPCFQVLPPIHGSFRPLLSGKETFPTFAGRLNEGKRTNKA